MPPVDDTGFVPEAPAAKFRTVFTDEHGQPPDISGQWHTPAFMGQELVDSMQQRLAHLEESLFSMKMESSSRGANYNDHGFNTHAEQLESLVTERVASVTERADALMLLITEERMQRQLDVAAALQRITSVEMRAEASEATAHQVVALQRASQDHATLSEDLQQRVVSLAAAEAYKQLRVESEMWRAEQEQSTRALEMKLTDIVAELYCSSAGYPRGKKEHRHDEGGDKLADKLASSSVSTVLLESTHAGTEAGTTSRGVDALHGGFDALQSQLRDVRLLMEEMDTRSRGVADGTFRRCDTLWAECQRWFAEFEQSINNERLERQDKDQLLANKLEAGLQRLIYKLENGSFRADDGSEVALGRSAMPLGASASYVSARIGTPPAPPPAVSSTAVAQARVAGEFAPPGNGSPCSIMPWLFTRNSLVPNPARTSQDKSGSPPPVLRRTPPRDERSAMRWRWQLPSQTQPQVMTPWRFSSGPVASVQIAPPAIVGQPPVPSPGHGHTQRSPSTPATVAVPPASPAAAQTGRPVRQTPTGAVVIASPITITRQRSASPRTSRGRVCASPGPASSRLLQLRPTARPAAAHSPIPSVVASTNSIRGRSPSPCRTPVSSVHAMPTQQVTSSPHASVAGSPTRSPFPSLASSPTSPIPTLGSAAATQNKDRTPVGLAPTTSPAMKKRAFYLTAVSNSMTEERGTAAMPIAPLPTQANACCGNSVHGMQVEEREQWMMHLRALQMANQSLVEQINVRDKLLQHKAHSSPTSSPLMSKRPVLLEPAASRPTEQLFSPALDPRSMVSP